MSPLPMPTMPFKDRRQSRLLAARALVLVRFVVYFVKLIKLTNIVPDEAGTRYQLHLTDRAEWQHTLREKELIEVFYAKTAQGQK